MIEPVTQFYNGFYLSADGDYQLVRMKAGEWNCYKKEDYLKCSIEPLFYESYPTLKSLIAALEKHIFYEVQTKVD